MLERVLVAHAAAQLRAAVEAHPHRVVLLVALVLLRGRALRARGRDAVLLDRLAQLVQVDGLGHVHAPARPLAARVAGARAPLAAAPRGSALRPRPALGHEGGAPPLRHHHRSERPPTALPAKMGTKTLLPTAHGARTETRHRSERDIRRPYSHNDIRFAILSIANSFVFLYYCVHENNPTSFFIRFFSAASFSDL